MSPFYKFVESPIGDRFPKAPARFDRLKRSWSVLASDASKRPARPFLGFRTRMERRLSSHGPGMSKGFDVLDKTTGDTAHGLSRI